MNTTTKKDKMKTYTFNSTEQTDLFAPFTANEIEYQLATSMMGNTQYANAKYKFNDANRFINVARVLSILSMLGNGKKPQSTQ
tara:strand:+ start:360 stop:608 length:249 start_codon:yes stop_codon:yes gene_type:complete